MSTIPHRQTKTVSEVRNVAVDFRGKLDDGELLTGAPTIAEVTTTNLTFANQAVNTSAIKIRGVSVAIGQAVQFKVSGGTADTTYTIRITVGTTATPAQTLIETVRLQVIAD
jgi:hypothetical protein